MVKTRDGKTLYYGKNNGSKLVLGTITMAYYLSEIKDADGNYVKYKYTTVNGECLLTEISYTGNAVAGSEPYNKIKFFYKHRQDKNIVFPFGREKHADFLLDRIEVYSFGHLLRKYALKYTYDGLYSKLYEVWEEGLNGKKKNPTRIEYYHRGGDSYTSRQLDVYNLSSTGDFNGDGKTDVITFQTEIIGQDTTRIEKIKIIIDGNNGNTIEKTFDPNSFTAPAYLYGNNIYDQAHFFASADFDGDGKDEIVLFHLFPYPYDSHKKILYSLEFWGIDNNQQLVLEKSYVLPHLFSDHVCNVWESKKNSVKVGDFDGDGILDLLLILNNINGSGQNAINDYLMIMVFPAQIYQGETLPYRVDRVKNTPLIKAYEDDKDILVRDFNGDGKSDFMVLYPDAEALTNIQNGTYNAQQHPADLPSGKTKIFRADFTIFYGEPVFYTTMIHNSNFVAYSYLNTDAHFPKIIATGDFNGDGRTDLVVENSDSVATVYFMKQNTFVPGNSFDMHTTSAFNAEYFFMKKMAPTLFPVNWNGDDKTDIVMLYRIKRMLTVGFSQQVLGVEVDVHLSNGKGFYFTDTIFNPGIDWSGGINTLVSDFDGDLKQELWVKNNEFKAAYSFRYPFLVHKIINGRGYKDVFEYTTTANTQVYSHTDYQYPEIRSKFTYPVRVVQFHSFSNPNGGMNSDSYFYYALHFDRERKQLLGFYALEKTAGYLHRKQVVHNSFIADKHIMLPKDSKVINTYNQQELSKNINYYTFLYVPDSSCYKTLLQRTVAQNLLTGVTTTTENTFDDYGNRILTRTVLNEGDTKETTFAYDDPTGYGIPSYPVSTTQTHTVPGQESYSLSKQFSYDNHGHIVSVKNLKTNTTVLFSDFDAFGNFGRKRTIYDDGTTLEEIFNYDNKGRFITQYTDAFGNQTTYTYNQPKGLLTSKTDFFGRTTSYLYDEFLVPKQTVFPTGLKKKTTRTLLSNGDVSVNTTMLTSSDSEVDNNATQYNITGQPVRYADFDISKTYSYYDDGKINVSETQGNGNMLHITSTTQYYYDGRIRSKDINGNTSQYAYYGNTVSVTDPAGLTYTKEYYANGKLKNSLFPEGNTLHFVYGSTGKPVQITANGIQTLMQYDTLGNNTLLDDPDAGPTNYQYDLKGNLIEQTNANSQAQQNEYDPYGRIITEHLPEGDIVYEYYASGPGKDKLKKITGYNGWYTEYTYDNFGRTASVTYGVDGQAYTETFQYDEANRVVQKNDVWGNTETFQYDEGEIKNYHTSYNGILSIDEEIWGSLLNSVRLSFEGNNNAADYIQEYEYDSYGQLVRKTGTVSDNSYSWSYIISETYTYDNIKHDLIKRKTEITQDNTPVTINEEIFAYDDLDRLTETVVSRKNGAGNTHYSYQYDITGNLIYKTGLGQMSYDPQKKHAVSRISNLELPDGIQLHHRIIEYTSFGKVKLIAENGDSLFIYYGPDRNRWKSVYKHGDEVVYTRYYFSDGEKDVYPDGTYKIYRYITGTDGIYAVDIKTPNEDKIYFAVTDRQGSITGLIDPDTKEMVCSIGYDAWGRERKYTTYHYQYITTPSDYILDGDTLIIPRGYTGHEMLRPFGLINMNGRVYDPLTSRFLSPDNYVQDPSNPQNYNRYAYALNNPLKYTDPSGEFWNLVIGGLIGGTINWLAHGAEFSWEGLEYFGVGVLAGALSAGVGSGISSALAPGGSFLSGFIGTNTISTTGIVSGAISGAASGITSGLIMGTGNSVIKGENFSKSFNNGLEQAAIQGFVGGVLGSVMGGLDAYLQKKDILTGSYHNYERVTDGKNLYYKKTFEKDISEKMLKKMGIKELPVTDDEFSITIKAPKGTYMERPLYIVPKGEGLPFNTTIISNKVLNVHFYGNPSSGNFVLAIVKQPFRIKGQYFYNSQQTYSSIFMFLNYLFK